MHCNHLHRHHYFSLSAKTCRVCENSQPANRSLKGTVHEKSHCNSAHESSPPASLRVWDSHALTPSRDKASLCHKPQQQADKNLKASRCNPKGKSQEKAVNFKQRKDAKPSALAESANNKQYKESHGAVPHGKKKVCFRDASPATSESGRLCSQRDKKRHSTRRVILEIPAMISSRVILNSFTCRKNIVFSNYLMPGYQKIS